MAYAGSTKTIQTVEYVRQFYTTDSTKLIKQLMEENRKLKQQLAYIQGISSEQLELKYYEKNAINKSFIIKKQPMDFEYELIPHFKFVTITFDPQKFGTDNDQQQEEQYILHQLNKLKEQQQITTLYGCFELHKTGTTHAHMILGTNYETEIYKQLKKAFTDNPHNRRAIDIQLVKKPAKEYIDKTCENTPDKKWFKIKTVDELNNETINDINKWNKQLKNFSTLKEMSIDLESLDFGI